MLLGQTRPRTVHIRGDGEYVEVELRLRAATTGGTSAELRVINGRTYPETSVPLDSRALGSLGPLAYGEALGRQLFAGTELGRQYDDMRSVHEGRGVSWRLRLRLDDPALRAIRWERICHLSAGAWAPIGAAADTPFSRFVYGGTSKQSRTLTERPIEALFVASLAEGPRPAGLSAISRAEYDAMRQALDAPGHAEITVRELVSGGSTRPTLGALRQALTSAPAIVHFLCHGIKEPAGTSLLLEDDNGEPLPVSAADVLDAFRGAAPRPRLVVLSACQSAATSGATTFTSLGPELAAAGVHAVVAMTDTIATETARTFCTAFYQRLFTHGIVDRATNEARASVREAWDWGVPVLFSCLSDSQLIEFEPGRVDAQYLDVSGRVTRTVAAARTWGEEHGAAQEMITAINELIAELEKSHSIITNVTSEYRAAANVVADFPAAFNRFRVDFKKYYDDKTWRQERTRCHEVDRRMGPALSLVHDAGSAEDFAQFERDLHALSNADGSIIEHLGQFLDRMDSEVDAIAALLVQGDVDAALTRYRDFDLHISPTFRKSKALLEEISERGRRVVAA